MCVGIGAPPYCFVLAVYFMRATTGRPYKNNKTLSLPVGEITYLRSKCAMKRSAILNRPQHCSHYLSASADVRIYKKPSPVGEGGSRRLTDEVSLALFALYIRLRTNKRSPTNSVGGDGLAAARSRSGSDTALWCHSLPSRRFATSTPRENIN